ncbi:MAG: EAL domain-containing protein [Lachnospiraceae bacterium]|nr:EAL domain-containing protein [Lachnospiraceae bacterium]
MNSNEGLNLFLDLLDNLDMTEDDFRIIHKNITESLPRLAEEFHLAKLEVHYMVFPNVFQLGGDDYTLPTDFHHEAADESEALVIRYDTVRHEKFEILAYPWKDHTWDDTEYRAVRSMANVVSVMMSRAAMLNDLHRSNYIDILTGLSNISGLRKRGMELEMQNTLENYSGIYFEIKDFPSIIKKYGQSNSDVILRQYALRLNQCIKTKLETAVRISEDIFFLLVQSEHLDDILMKLADINIIIDFKGEKVIVPIRIHAGVYRATSSNTIDVIESNTSIAHDIAKSSDKDFVFYTPEMAEKATFAKKTSVIFPQAMSNREVIAYYQPKYDLKTKKIVGAEALVRWMKDGKMIQPSSFLPALENDGSVRQLDFYMLELVCEDLAYLIKAGIEPVRISVNYSQINLQNPSLAEDTMEILKRYNVDPKYIEIELTETSSYEDHERLEAFLTKMHDFGFTVSMDDFGTGYSSLNLFKNFNFDVVKLDKSFLDNIENEEVKDNIIVENMIRMLKELNVEVVAEGVETQSQLDFLSGIGCDITVQGYYFDKPIALDTFTEKLNEVGSAEA